MGAQPTTNNELADFFNTVVGLFITADETAVEAYLLTVAPVLEGPVVGIFTNDVIDLLMHAIKKNASGLASAIAIAIETGSEESSVNQTWAALKAAKASGDANAISAADQAFINAAASLAHSDGSANNVNS